MRHKMENRHTGISMIDTSCPIPFSPIVTSQMTRVAKSTNIDTTEAGNDKEVRTINLLKPKQHSSIANIPVGTYIQAVNRRRQETFATSRSVNYRSEKLVESTSYQQNCFPPVVDNAGLRGRAHLSVSKLSAKVSAPI
jgi:hypothetical protein